MQSEQEEQNPDKPASPMKMPSLKETISGYRHLLLAGAFCAGCPAASGQFTRDSTIKILSWNIFMLPGIAAKSSPSQRAATIGELINTRDYDVIVFQEAFSAKSRRIIYSLVHNKYLYSLGPANRKRFSGKTNSGVWILSRYPIVRSESIYFTSKLGMDAFSRKGALFAEISFQGNHLQVIGTHLQSAGNSGIRELQCQQIYRELLKPNQRDSIPQVICGDMNIDKYSASKAYANMLHLLHAKDGMNATDNSFSFDPSTNDVCQDLSQHSKMIDYILFSNQSGGIKTIQSKIVQFRKKWSTLHQDLSDHYSIESEIQLTSVGRPLATRPENREVEDLAEKPATFSHRLHLEPSYQIWFPQKHSTAAFSLAAMIPLSEKVQVGITGAASVDQFYRESKSNNRIRYAGLRLEYLFHQTKFLRISFPLTVGRGSISSETVSSTALMERSLLGRGAFVSPAIAVGVRLAKSINAFVGSSILIFADNDLVTKERQPVFSVSGGLRIGLFKERAPATK